MCNPCHGKLYQLQNLIFRFWEMSTRLSFNSKGCFKKIFFTFCKLFAKSTNDWKALFLDFKRKLYSRVHLIGQFPFEIGRPWADWGPNSFGDNLIWVGQGQIWKSFKYVHRNLDWDQHHYCWRSTREERYFIKRFKRYFSICPVFFLINPNVRTYCSIYIQKSRAIKPFFAE